MKNAMVGLIKRDGWLLLHQWRRILVLWGSILLMDIILALYERNTIIEQEILGVTVQKFLAEPDKFPIQWIWNQVGILIIVIDFVRKDLSLYSSCFLPHIQERKWYWYSKLFCGGILALGIFLFQMLEKYFILAIYDNTDYCIKIDGTMLVKSGILLLLGMCTIYWLYAVVSLLLNEIIGFIVCVAYVVLGLPIKMPAFYCAGFMYNRGSIGMAIAMMGIVLIFALVAGTKKLNNMDILSE